MQHHTKAIELLQDWSKWLVGIDSAAIAAIGALTTRDEYDLTVMSVAISGVFAAAFFLVSLALANWLLLALPGVVQRASEQSDQDIFAEGTYAGVGRRVVFFARGQHLLFIAGMVAVVAFVLAPHHSVLCWSFLAVAWLTAARFVYEVTRWPDRFHKG